MNAKAETQTISLEYELPHPPAKVWRALTQPELVAAWPAYAFAFDGAGKGWQRMVGEGLTQVLAQIA